MGCLGVCFAIDVPLSAVGHHGLFQPLVDLGLQFILRQQAGGFACPALLGVLGGQSDNGLDDLVPNPAAGRGLEILLHQQAGEAVGPTEIVHNALKQLRSVRNVGAPRGRPLGEGADSRSLNLLEPGLLLLLDLAGFADELERILSSGQPREILQIQRENLLALLALPGFLGWRLARVHGRSSCKMEAIMGTADLAPSRPSLSICCMTFLR